MTADNIGYGEGFSDMSEEEEDNYKFFCLNHKCNYRTREILKHGKKGCIHPEDETIEDHLLIIGSDKKGKKKTSLYKHCNQCIDDCKIPKCPRCGERLIPYMSDDGFTSTEPQAGKQYG